MIGADFRGSKHSPYF